MLVLIQRETTCAEVDSICRMFEDAGIASCHWQEENRAVVASVGLTDRPIEERLRDKLEGEPGIECLAGNGPYPLASRTWKDGRTVVPIVNGLSVGSRELVIIAGPCSVEGRDGLLEAAVQVKKRGADMLRGGAFKPRSSPHSFQGLGTEGLEYLKEARKRTGLPVVTEVMDTADLDAVEAVADVIQIGSRNMHNFALLKAVGRTRKPVLLKRGMCATIDEWLQAAEYILCGGNARVILCERGIRTFEPATRNTLDLNAVPLVKKLTHLPVIVDPSHGTGLSELVIPMSLAAVAAGADGLILEVHPAPEMALCDGRQSLTPEQFSELVTRTSAVAGAVGRVLRCD